MPFYESVFIARQDISSAQVDQLVENFSQLITDQGGTVPKTEYWGLRNLAYRIKKNRKGHYVLMNIDAAPAVVQEMERQMRLNEDVIRLLTVRVNELEEGPSAIMQSRGRDRGGRGGPRGRGPESDRGPSDRGGSERAAAPKPADETKPADAAPPAETAQPAEGES